MTKAERGECLKSIRAILDKTQDELHRLLLAAEQEPFKIDLRTLQNWESGRSLPGGLALSAYAELLESQGFTQESGSNSIKSLLLDLFSPRMTKSEWTHLWQKTVLPPLEQPSTAVEVTALLDENVRRQERDARTRLASTAEPHERTELGGRLVERSATFLELKGGPDPIVFTSPDCKLEFAVLVNGGSFRVRIPEDWEPKVAPVDPHASPTAPICPTPANRNAAIGHITARWENYAVVRLMGERKRIEKGYLLRVFRQSQTQVEAKVLKSSNLFCLVKGQVPLNVGDAVHYIARLPEVTPSKLRIPTQARELLQKCLEAAKTESRKLGGIS